MTAVAAPLFSVAVIVPLSMVVMVPAVALKVVVVEFGGILTDAGTVRQVLLDERATVVVPVSDALARVTVQVEVLLEASIVGVH
jgi:hypothetical protein